VGFGVSNQIIFHSRVSDYMNLEGEFREREEQTGVRGGIKLEEEEQAVVVLFC
jgi:hypothetical protein